MFCGYMIINRVASSGILSLDLEEFFPEKPIDSLDMKEWLFHGLILKEADFRQKLNEHEWGQYEGKIVCLVCTTDAIVPLWAYMLFATKLHPFASEIFYGDEKEYLSLYYHNVICAIKPEEYLGKRVVIKGCGDKPVPASAYVDITTHLLPFVKSIMYGEPCSTVPVYKEAKVSDHLGA